MAVEDRLAAALAEISEVALREQVKALAIPRHFEAEAENNAKVGAWIQAEFEALGLETEVQGRWRNIVAWPAAAGPGPFVLVGAHFDSVPGSPGADDNASAVAAMLQCARVVSKAVPKLPICFAAFNKEEDGKIGSEDFVTTYLKASSREIKLAHILEMVGYCSHEPGSQRVPEGLPIELPDVGDFLAIIGDAAASASMDRSRAASAGYAGGLPVLTMAVPRNIGEHFRVFERSDHFSFWMGDVSATMWTDTSEYRNDNYHQASDTPETLDYEYLHNVCRLLALSTILDAEALL